MQSSKHNSATVTKTIQSFVVLWCIFSLLSCANSSASRENVQQQKVHSGNLPSEDHVFTLILIGDTGNNYSTPYDPVMESLKEQIDKVSQQSAILFLGDNLYPAGLPPEDHSSRVEMEEKLSKQLSLIKDFPGRIVFVPGNHDWQNSGPNGLEWVRRQEKFVETTLNWGNTFLPDSGYPGPVQLTLHEEKSADTLFNIQLIVLDTQWWLHPHEKPLDDNVNAQKNIILDEMDEMISNNKYDEIIVAAHHPLFSYGRHGGKFSLRTHLLPPIFGSLYVAYRNIWGLKQDLANYSDLKEGLLKSFEKAEGAVYVAGHDHSLQYIPNEGDHYLVSGSASKTTFVQQKNDEAFTYGGKGFIIVKYCKDRSKTIEFWNEKGDRVYLNQIETD